MWIPPLLAIDNRTTTPSRCYQAGLHAAPMHCRLGQGRMSALVAVGGRRDAEAEADGRADRGAFDAGLGKPYQDTVTAFGRTARQGVRGSKTFVIDDPPSMSRQPLDCILGHGANMGRRSTVPTDRQLSLRADIAAAVTNTGATFINTTGWFCYQNLCPMVIGDKLVFLDAGQITQTYAPSPSASCARYSGDPFLRTSGDRPTAVISCT